MAQEDIQIQHEGTDTMWTSNHSKPLQGTSICVMRSKITNYPFEYNSDTKRQITTTTSISKASAPGLEDVLFTH